MNFIYHKLDPDVIRPINSVSSQTRQNYRNKVPKSQTTKVESRLQFDQNLSTRNYSKKEYVILPNKTQSMNLTFIIIHFILLQISLFFQRLNAGRKEGSKFDIFISCFT